MQWSELPHIACRLKHPSIEVEQAVCACCTVVPEPYSWLCRAKRPAPGAMMLSRYPLTNIQSGVRLYSLG